MLKLVARLYLGYSVIRFKSSTLFTRITRPILTVRSLSIIGSTSALHADGAGSNPVEVI